MKFNKYILITCILGFATCGIAQADPYIGSYYGLDGKTKVTFVKCTLVGKDKSKVVALVADVAACKNIGGEVFSDTKK